MGRRSQRGKAPAGWSGLRAKAVPLTIVALLGIGLWAAATAVNEPTIGGAWSLVRGDGAPVTDRDFRGRYLLLYFGYTNCPDVCPTTLSAMADAMRLLGSRADRVQPVFITVDPVDDTPTVMRGYVRNFGPHLIGLTGTPAEIGRIEREYRIRSTVQAGHGSSAPLLDHTAVLMLVGPGGSYVTAFPSEESGRALALRLSPYLGG